MNKPQIIITFGVLFCLLVTISQTIREVSAAPSYTDYDSLRDLYELLMEKELLADVYDQNHRLVRKNSRSPSLRLRFGRRSDPSFYQQTSNERFQNSPEASTNEK